jgi:ribosome recycling factor
MFVDMEDLNTKKRRAWLRKEQSQMEKGESLLSTQERRNAEWIAKRTKRPKNRMMYSDSEEARAEKVQKTMDMFVVGLGMFFIGVLVGAIAMLMWVS